MSGACSVARGNRHGLALLELGEGVSCSFDRMVFIGIPLVGRIIVLKYSSLKQTLGHGSRHTTTREVESPVGWRDSILVSPLAG